MTASTTSRSTRLRSLLAGSVITAGAVAGLIGLAAPANALPESTIKSDCAQRGWDYQTVTRPDGTTVSVCCPTGLPGEISGGKCSIYVNGTLSARLEEGTTKPPKNRFPVGQLPTAVMEPVR